MPVDVAALRAAHPLPAVLRRCGIEIPDAGSGVRDEWRLHCPLPSHPPTRSPSMVVHISGRMGGRWHCFACEAGGDCIAFVQGYAQVGFLRAVTMIGAGEPIPRGPDPHFELRPATVDSTGSLHWQAAGGSDREAPDPTRTPPARLYEATAEAWRYYSLPGLAAAARRYLGLRGIDVSALEAREHRVLVGHTPALRSDPSEPIEHPRPLGLVTHLRRKGFGDGELVDAGLASRYPDGTVRDFFSHRLVLPVRDRDDRVVGFLGRDVAGLASRPKYLNSPQSAIYDKAALLYRATRRNGRTPLVVVEGALDALAIDSLAARCSVELRAVSPSGTALTAAQQALVAAASAGAPVLCPDGDPAGRRAAMRWVMEMTVAGQEVVALALPNGHDPASWLDLQGANGLAAFERKGCLDAARGDVRPVHAGRFLAEAGASQDRPLPRLRSILGKAGACLDSVGARRRFAEQAGRGLAQAGCGPDGWLGRTIAADIEAAVRLGPSPCPPRSAGVSL
ncbi:MAG: toprim domain-containing protein [Actinomycetota bacterium]|nr:toprim domain-containing protein [Actinomycetota bacterium]